MATGAEYPLSGRISTFPSIRGYEVYISIVLDPNIAERLQKIPFPPAFSILYHLPVWQIFQDIPRGMRCLAGHRRGRRLSSRLGCCLSPPIACCEVSPQQYHQLLCRSLLLIEVLLKKFLWRSKLKVAESCLQGC